MTNFILWNPRVVFVHLPKTGGTSLRKALGGTIEQRFFGHIPSDYAGLPRFAIIREPKDRFMSAFRMFKYGNRLEDDYYSQPRWPDLTISKALDVIEDPWVGFDRSQRSLAWNFKHHVIPQTHPFNCLAQAEEILRFENLQADFKRLCSSLGLSARLPNLRGSRGEHAAEDVWRPEDETRFNRLFETDYQVLGYADPSQQAESEACPYEGSPSLAEDKTVFGMWSAYFSDRKIDARHAPQALPDADCPLEPFADEIIPGRPGKTWAGRAKDLIDHFHQLQPEFSGASRLAHLLACTIVVLRRDPTCAPALKLFWRILDEQLDVIQSDLSLRWLVAISDTIADIGRNPAERTTAMNASILANTCKLYESELSVFYPKRPWPPKARVAAGGELFDGMLTYWTEKGDLIDNMFARSADIATLSPTAGKVLMEVIERVRKGPTVYRRFDRIFGQPAVPLLDDDVKLRMQRMIRRKL